jgi:acylphosphatase
MSEHERVELRIRGRVQGVGFRWMTQAQANRAGLRGWVRNEPDGSVVAVAQGDRAALEAFAGWCRQGPPGARVEAVAVYWSAPLEDLPDRFEIRH